MRRAFIFNIFFLFILLLGMAIAMLLFGRVKAAPGEWLSFAGSVLGALVAVGAAIGAVTYQIEASEKQRLRTMRVLLEGIRSAGVNMQQLATTDPAGSAEDAKIAYDAALSVAAELRSHSAPLAIIAQELAVDLTGKQLSRTCDLSNAGGSITPEEAIARGAELAALADRLLNRLQGRSAT